MKKYLSIFVVVAVLVVAAGIASADPYPQELMDKCMAMKADAEVKKDMPNSLPGISVVGSEEANKMWKSKNAVFLDNRVKTQYDAEKIEGAKWFFADDLLKNPSLADTLDKNKDYVVYCNGVHCWRSPATALMLQHLGFTKVHWYRDGLPDWKKRGYPTE